MGVRQKNRREEWEGARKGRGYKGENGGSGSG